MSQATEPAWRGIAAEEAEEIPPSLATFLRLRSRRLLADMLRPHRRASLVILILIVIANVAALVGPWLVGVGVDEVPQLTKTHDAVPLTLVVIGFGVAVVVQALTTRAYISAIGRMGGKVVLELRRRLFGHFQALPVAFHERYTTGKVISRQVSDIDAISDLFEEGLDSLVSAIFTLLLVGTGMLLLDWPLALVVMAGFVPLIWLTAWFRRQSSLAYRRTRETIALVIVQFVETFGGITAVQAFRREKRNQELFTDLNAGYADASLRSQRLVAVYFPGVTLVGNLAIAAILLYGGLRVIDGDMRVGVLVTFLLYLQRFFDPLQDLSQFYSAFQSAAAAMEKISGVLDEDPEVAEPDAPVSLPDLEDAARAGRGVRFEAVRFGYRDKVVLPGLDLDIPAGQTVAVVGSTGAGKTTIARLLARFYDPREGRILLDGVDLRSLSESDLRRQVIMITQENFLFSGTIAENIELGKPGATRAQIEAAAAAIGADGFIRALPDGYDQQVGKRGGRISAGQRQLISFARAFLAAPAVLVLDEATSLLDIPSERLVQQALRTILTGRTAMIIAHRLSTVEIADRVLVIGDGQIMEDGPPAELMTQGGDYSALHEGWQESLA
jgi:ATP-binding cassette subfamily B protein